MPRPPSPGRSDLVPRSPRPAANQDGAATRTKDLLARLPRHSSPLANHTTAPQTNPNFRAAAGQQTPNRGAGPEPVSRPTRTRTWRSVTWVLGAGALVHQESEGATPA